MLSQLKLWFSPPVFEDEEKTRRANLLSTGINAMTIGCFVGLISLFFESFAGMLYGAMGGLLIFFQILRWMMKRGRVRIAGFMFAISISLAVTLSLAVLGTVRTPGVAILMLPILASEIFSGGRATLGIIGLNSLLVGGLIWAETQGILPTPAGNIGVTQWVILTAAFGVAGAFLHLATKTIEQSRARARYEFEARLQLEEQQRKSEKRFRLMLENIGEVITLFDRNGVCSYVSPTIRHTLGYEPEERVGRIGFEIVHPDDLAATQDLLSQMTAVPNAQFHAEFRLRHENGTWRWVSAVGKNLLDDPDVQAVVVNYRDVTEQHLNDERIRASEARFRSILAAIPDLIFISGADGTYHDFFTVHEERLGMPREAIIGRTIHDIFPPDIAQPFQQKLDEAVATSEVVEYEYNLPRLSEEGTWFQARAVAYNTAEGQRIVWLARDISRQKRAEAEILKLNAELEQRVEKRTRQLKESEELFRMLFEQSPDAVWMIEPPDSEAPWHIFDCNEAACRMTGYTREELVGASIGLINAGEDDPDFFERLKKFGRLTLEDRNRRKDGSIFPVDVSASLLTLHGKKLILGIDRDITERKRAEEELRQASEAMQAANKELEAFAYSVSHDLRAPLRAIDGFSTILEEMYASQLDEQGQRYLSNVKQATWRMGALIDDILKLSRISRQELHRVPCSLSDLSELIVQELQTQYPQRQVEVQIQPKLVTQGDPNLLQVMLENLLGNAWKFSSKQPVAQISFGILEREQEKVYFVRDNGAGFDMAYANRLFGAFQRLHRYEEFEGTGIGLATVQRIIARHGGRVWAESEVEKGATFFFTLPG